MLDMLRERGEEAMNKVLSDLLSNKVVADQLGKTVTRAADAKRTVDRNLQFLLSMLNLPSRSDFNRLLTKVETLHGSLTNINMKLDRLLAEKHGAPSKTTPARRARPRKAAHRAAKAG
jgi:hypothetical protein